MAYTAVSVTSEEQCGAIRGCAHSMRFAAGQAPGSFCLCVGFLQGPPLLTQPSVPQPQGAAPGLPSPYPYPLDTCVPDPQPPNRADVLFPRA